MEINMDMDAATAFGELLRKNPKAAAFYDSCTPRQRQAILLQLERLNQQSQLQAFVDNLPGATL